MLSGTTWKPEAVVRLFAGVFLCMYGGAVVSALLLGRLKEGASAGMLYAVAATTLLCLGAAIVLLGREWRPDRLRLRLGILLTCIYGGLFGGALAQSWVVSSGPSVWQMVIASLSFQGAALVLMWPFLNEHGEGFARAFGVRLDLKRAVVAGCVAALLFLPVGWALQQISVFIMTHLPIFKVEPQEQQAVQTLRMAGTSLDRVALGLVTVLIAPVAEEVLFRGVLYRWVKSLGFPQAALWGTSLLFAVVHLNLLTFIPLLGLALVLVWLYERTNNLMAPIAAHMTFNALNLALFYLVT